MRILALDVGDRRIGMALSDPGGILASALGALERRGIEKDIRALLRTIQEHDVERVVIGLPKLLDGSLGEQARKVQEFAARLGEACDLPLAFWDERLSTFTAQEKLLEAGARHVSRGRLDAAAAAQILQGYLDSPEKPGEAHALPSSDLNGPGRRS